MKLINLMSSTFQLISNQPHHLLNSTFIFWPHGILARSIASSNHFEITRNHFECILWSTLTTFCASFPFASLFARPLNDFLLAKLSFCSPSRLFTCPVNPSNRPNGQTNPLESLIGLKQICEEIELVLDLSQHHGRHLKFMWVRFWFFVCFQFSLLFAFFERELNESCNKIFSGD